MVTTYTIRNDFLAGGLTPVWLIAEGFAVGSRHVEQNSGSVSYGVTPCGLVAWHHVSEENIISILRVAT